MQTQRPGAAPTQLRRRVAKLSRPADSFGMLFVLLILDYVAASVVTGVAWGRVGLVALLGLTLVFALRTSRARRIWQIAALLYLFASVLLTVISLTVPGARDLSSQTSIAGGLLLLVTPFAIARRISTHRVVTNETVLGAICVYLLLGFSFSFIYSAIGFASATPFFVGQRHATQNDYLFFSYSTLTTVGYGNLVPAGSLGQSFAMLEALLGQIYLVIIVARLVSLWGQARPTSASPNARGAGTGDVQHDADQSAMQLTPDMTART